MDVHPVRSCVPTAPADHRRRCNLRLLHHHQVLLRTNASVCNRAAAESSQDKALALAPCDSRALQNLYPSRIDKRV